MSLPILLDLESDDDSIIEISKPPRPTPLLVHVDDEIEEENIVLNVSIPKDSHLVSKFVTPTNSNCLEMEDNVSPYHWTSDMRNFYNNESREEETFDVKILQKQMVAKKSLWDVGNFFTEKLTHGKKRAACFNCGEYGHNERNCKPNSCLMCGLPGHRMKNCPGRKCLSCGKRSNKFIPACTPCLRRRNERCSRCGVTGHTMVDCTDNWRRFHHVTTLQQVEPPPEPAHKALHQIWCSNCAKKGHIDLNCELPKLSNFAPSSIMVCSYRGSFTTDKAEKQNLNPSKYGESNNAPFSNNFARHHTPVGSDLSTPFRKGARVKRYFGNIANPFLKDRNNDSEQVKPSNEETDIVVIHEKVKQVKNAGHLESTGRKELKEIVCLTKKKKKKKKKKKNNPRRENASDPATINIGVKRSDDMFPLLRGPPKAKESNTNCPHIKAGQVQFVNKTRGPQRHQLKNTGCHPTSWRRRNYYQGSHLIMDDPHSRRKIIHRGFEIPQSPITSWNNFLMGIK